MYSGSFGQGFLLKLITTELDGILKVVLLDVHVVCVQMHTNVWCPYSIHQLHCLQDAKTDGQAMPTRLREAQRKVSLAYLISCVQ